MSRTGEPLWETLLEAGLVQGEAPATDTIESPWYVKALLAFSGWLAAMFLLGFVGVGFQFIMDSGVASLITGGAMMGGAYAILRIPKNEFVEHLALAMSIAGQALAIYAFFEILDTHGALLWALVALLQILLAVIMPNDVHRVWSSYAAAVTLALTLASMRVPYLAHGLVMLLAAWIWLNEFRYRRYMRPMRAIGYGLVIALIQLTGTTLFHRENLGGLIEYGPGEALLPAWLGELATGAVMLYVVWRLLQRRACACATLRPDRPAQHPAVWRGIAGGPWHCRRPDDYPPGVCREQSRSPGTGHGRPAFFYFVLLLSARKDAAV